MKPNRITATLFRLNSSQSTSTLHFSILLLACCCLLTGCLVDAPLSDPANAELDEQLLGHWTATQGTTETHLFIGRHSTKGNPASVIEVREMAYDTKEMKTVPSAKTYYGSITTIGKLKFVNKFHETVSETADLSGPGSYERWTKLAKRSCNIFKYEIDGNNLNVSSAELGKYGDLVKSGDLKQQEGITTVASLLAYLHRTGGAALFSEVHVYHKAGTNAAQPAGIAARTPQGSEMNGEREAAREADARAATAIRRSAASARVTRLEAEFGTLRQQLLETQRNSDEYDSKVTSFKLNHKAALLAIEAAKEGSKVTFDDKKSDGERLLGALVGGIGAGYALKAENREEMKEVVNALISIEANQRDFKNALNRIRRDLSTTQTELDQVRRMLD